MSRFPSFRTLWVAGAVCALLIGAATAGAQQSAPSQQTYDSAETGTNQAPGRVAQLAYLSGQVQFQPAGENEWGTAELNRPMVIGDRLLTGDDGLAVLELGDASVRIDNDSAFDFLNLAEDNVQIELSQGTLNAAVRQLGQDENFEVDTPTVAFVAAAPGIYRIDDSPTGTGTMVTVFQGSGTVYGENGVSRQVVTGTSYRFNDSALTSVDVTDVPPPDAFDRFCEARDQNHARYAEQQQQYVPPDMIGSAELDQYGTWDAVPEYGNVWYPTSVPVGWAPYRYGRWVWIDPWGWTWVDNAPWGFAPFHYGRWAYIGSRWGWIPGPVDVRPVYAPAMVGFIGGGPGLSLAINVGGGGPVAWFPLGPRDIYVPWFVASQGYFNNVNVTNIRRVYVNRTIINNYYVDYRAGRRPSFGRHEYRYRNMANAVTAVPRNVFTSARPVHPAVLKLNRTELARARVAFRPGVNPGRASLGLQRPTAHPATLRGREAFTRPVVARRRPPPRPLEFTAREKIIAGQHGQPLTRAQLQRLRPARHAAEPHNPRVKLVATRAGGSGAPARPEPISRSGRSGAAPRSAEPPARRVGPTEPPFKNTVRPIRAPLNPAAGTPPRPNELPSARFARPGEHSATLPRAPAIRPADESRRNTPAPGRLPVVKPIERAPQLPALRAAQQRPGQAGVEAQQRIRAQQSEQRQQRLDQEQQRAQRQQAQQARTVQMQQQQRLRGQQLQQQRQVEAQAQQRARDQAARQQQQRSMQIQREQRTLDMQRQQQTFREEQRFREQPIQRAPPPRSRPAPEHRAPTARRPPPPSSSEHRDR